MWTADRRPGPDLPARARVQRGERGGYRVGLQEHCRFQRLRTMIMGYEFPEPARPCIKDSEEPQRRGSGAAAAQPEEQAADSAREGRSKREGRWGGRGRGGRGAPPPRRGRGGRGAPPPSPPVLPAAPPPPRARRGLWSYVWKMTHAAWNRLMHALHGNGSSINEKLQQILERGEMGDLPCDVETRRMVGIATLSEWNLELINKDFWRLRNTILDRIHWHRNGPLDLRSAVEHGARTALCAWCARTESNRVPEE